MHCWKYDFLSVNQLVPFSLRDFFMSKFHSQLINATHLVKTYQSGLPLAHHIKAFFAKQKKFGSKDRKTIASICYHYFRCSALFDSQTPIEQALIQSVFLCETEESLFLKTWSPELNELIHLDAKEKLRYLNLADKSIFAYHDFLSSHIDSDGFSYSFLQQPFLFVRIRPGKKKAVVQKLIDNSIEHEWVSEYAIKIKNGTSLNESVKVNTDVVIQDYNSQRVFEGIQQLGKPSHIAWNVWDACAASGGKSILLYDELEGNIKITVSDVRESILKNLTVRLRQARVPIHQKCLVDLSKNSGFPKSHLFDLIICDVPCSGSGTWSRTPEQSWSFDANLLSFFVNKQQSIVKNTMAHLAKGGYFVYITCSVFSKENEDMVNYIVNEFSADCISMKYLKGYEMGADTMFVAFFKL